MKTIIIITSLIIVVLLIWLKRRSIKNLKITFDFVKLEAENESTKHLPTVSLNWLNNIENKYQNQEFNQFQNEHTELLEKLCSDVYSNSKYWENGKNHFAFFNELTKEQRIYFTLINFESQVNNGGVYQFLFNYPELALIALDSIRIAKIDKLALDYENVLSEYFGKFDSIQDLYSIFQNEKYDWQKRWNSFAEGYKELKTAEIIEEYFYKIDFIKYFQNKLILFVKQNKNKLFIEE